jgi:hypothetical protein
VAFVVFGCVFAARSAAKTQPNTTNYPPAEQLQTNHVKKESSGGAYAAVGCAAA